MSEQNPFSAPLSVPPVAPMGLAPASPFAPPPPPAPPAPVALPVPPPPAPPALPVREDHPSMTLTELSFQPVVTDELPVAAEPVAPPPAGLVGNVLPSGGGVSRSLSLGGGRLPLIGLVVVALLAAVGVVFGTGLLKGDEAAPPVVKKPAVAKPAKPAALPRGFKPVSVKKTGTLGRAYTVGVPAGWKRQAVKTVPAVHTDLALGDKVQSVRVSTTALAAGKTNLDALAKAGRAQGVKSVKGKAVGAIRTTKVAGHDARSFDVAAGGRITRHVMFVDGKTVYHVAGSTSSKAFTKFAPTFDQVLLTWAFAAK